MKTQEFLAQAKLSIMEEVNAKKQTLQFDDAVALLDGVTDLYVAKGKQVEHLNLKQAKPDEVQLRKLLLGPTGNLRAPTLRKGKVVVVGFNSEMYQTVFGA